MGKKVLGRQAFNNSYIYSPLFELMNPRSTTDTWLLSDPPAVQQAKTSLLSIKGVTHLNPKNPTDLTHTVVAPGKSRDDFEVTVKGRVVTIQTVGDSDESYSWSRKACDSNDLDAISAVMENGVLKVRIPAKEPVEPEVKKISIT